MNVSDGYNLWAETYDSVQNKTRDLENRAIRDLPGGRRFGQTIELGCGSGKNTGFLASISENLPALVLGNFPSGSIRIRMKYLALLPSFSKNNLFLPF